mmetsp:Transcript_56395/g.129391  ORF Transcript_56395/g.129391 Transcript_56395/m.129391 type:complete len:100 (+) Transcript_56395:814-1113(+)
MFCMSCECNLHSSQSISHIVGSSSRYTRGLFLFCFSLPSMLKEAFHLLQCKFFFHGVLNSRSYKTLFCIRHTFLFWELVQIEIYAHTLCLDTERSKDQH